MGESVLFLFFVSVTKVRKTCTNKKKSVNLHLEKIRYENGKEKKYNRHEKNISIYRHRLSAILQLFKEKTGQRADDFRLSGYRSGYQG